MGGEFREILKDKKVYSFYDILKNEEVLKTRHGLFQKYHKRFAGYVKREYSS